MKQDDDYFLALHFGQVAQVALASVQHCMPQAACAVEHFSLQQVLQPASSSEAAHNVRANSLIIFIGLIADFTL
ncbi:MAG: hypothetical protein AAB380_07065 [Verrucomicrobiota bacterium]